MTCRPLHLAILAAACLTAGEAAAGDRFTLEVRHRAEQPAGSGRFIPVHETVEWDARRTALILCDMWDRHWCPDATARVAEMAPRMDRLVRAAREKGALIIHAPSDCMDHYEGTPQRELARAAPAVEPQVPLRGWCGIDEQREPPLPIDDSDGGCDTDPAPEPHRAWTKQIAAIGIEEGDAITDNEEAYHLIRQRGIENVIVMGVHTNMCVLGRPFAIRQLVYQDLNVLLMRDLTDAMYNPQRPPYVSHFTGTDLVVEHIERYWCPTTTSDQILGGEPFRFEADDRTHVALVTAEQEYGSERTLADWARDALGRHFKVSHVHAEPQEGRHDLRGIEVLERADVVVLAVRRRTPTEAQMERIRTFVASGRPVVALRTSSHAFALRDGEPDPGHADWPGFDREVLGGRYEGHFGNRDGTAIRAEPDAADDGILRSFPREGFVSASWLYRSRDLEPGAQVLLWGEIEREGERVREPVAWTRTRPGGGRLFYTSLGHQEDFAEPAFRRMLTDALYWAVERPLPDPQP